MHATITQTRLDAVAAQLDRTAREAAHSEMVSDSTAADFAVAYLRALPRSLFAQSAEQCAPGETFAPADMLPGDADYIREQAALLGVELDGVDWSELRREYA